MNNVDLSPKGKQGLVLFPRKSKEKSMISGQHKQAIQLETRKILFVIAQGKTSAQNVQSTY